MKYTELFKNKIVEEYINTPNNLKSIKNLANKYKIGITSVSNWVKSSGYSIYNTSQHTFVNDTMFDIIDTEEKAYWLGFLYADGCVHSNDNRFELTIASIDIDHLIKFAKFMRCSDMSKIKYRNNNRECRIQFRSDHLKQSLINLGCVPNKTLILQFPDTSIFTSNDLIRHFIRGYIDGDGCLYVYRRKRNNREYPCLTAMGTFSFYIICLNIYQFLIIRKFHIE